MGVSVATGGLITFADTSGVSMTVCIDSHSVNFPRESGDTTCFQPTNNLATTATGRSSINGTFEGKLDDGMTFDPTDFNDETPVPADIILQFSRTLPSGVDTTQICTFKGDLTSFGPSVRTGEVNAVSGAFIGTGKPVWSKGGVA